MKAAVEFVLVAGIADWIQTVDVNWAVTSSCHPASDDERTAECLQLVRLLLDRELAEPGDVDVSGFKPWELDKEDAYREVERRWREFGNAAPNLGDICWLRLTPRGERLAERVAAAQEHR